MGDTEHLIHQWKRDKKGDLKDLWKCSKCGAELFSIGCPSNRYRQQIMVDGMIRHFWCSEYLRWKTVQEVLNQ